MNYINHPIQLYTLVMDITALRIQQWWRRYKIRRNYLSILVIFRKYRHHFFDLPCQARLTDYEKAVGFTEKSRCGAKQFSNKFGYFMEEIYNTSYVFNRLKLGEKNGNDGENDYSYFECKNRYDTMKQSMACKEITPKLEYAVMEQKQFSLFILTDVKNNSRNIPLHLGCSLSNINKIDGYDPEKHRWISGDYVYTRLFGTYGKDIKLFILALLSLLTSP
jgi:hypothetical protein